MEDRNFPVSADMLLGLGLGGFFDGICSPSAFTVAPHVTSPGYPPDNVRNLEINTLWDGISLEHLRFCVAGFGYHRRDH